MNVTGAGRADEGTTTQADLVGGSMLAHLLHALNQPLTGLQCSLELALIPPRTTEEYVRCLREGLELTGRMRALVHAIHELVDAQTNKTTNKTQTAEEFGLGAFLAELVDELRPVAEANGVRISLENDPAMTVMTVRRDLPAAVFRTLESALGLAPAGSLVRVEAESQPNTARVAIHWDGAEKTPEQSQLSTPELGLLMARAAFEGAGATWDRERTGNASTVSIRLPFSGGQRRAGD